jgi:hypothetical protein
MDGGSHGDGDTDDPVQEHIQAAEYRHLAEAAGDSTIKEDFFDWAAICEEVANNIDDRRASG